MINMSAVAMPSVSLVARRVGGETILISEKGDTLHTLNETGSFIWEHLDGRRSLGEIMELMREEFELPGEGSESEVCRFIEELAGKGIVSIRS